jgi:hypothetical protein
MIPPSFTLHIHQARVGGWRCTVRRPGRVITTSAHATPLDACTAALRRLGEDAGVPDVGERPRTEAQEGGGGAVQP